MYDIELLAVPTVAPSLQGRHLVHQLIDLQLLTFEFLLVYCDLRFALGELHNEGRGQITQFCCVHLSELARRVTDRHIGAKA